MLKKGFDLTDQQIDEAYRQIAHLLTMPFYFYSKVSKIIGKIENKKVIDIGCGNGFMLEQIQKDNTDNNIKIFGLDNCKDLVKSTQKRLGNEATIIQASANKDIPFQESDFDIVVSTEVIEHIKYPDLYLREINRILKKDGTLYITVPNGTAFLPFQIIAEKLPQNNLVTQFIHGEHPIKTPQPIATLYFYKEINELLTRNGFVIKRVTGFESFPYFFDAWRFLFDRLKLNLFVQITWRIQFLCDKVIEKLFPMLFYRLLFVLEPIK